MASLTPLFSWPLEVCVSLPVRSRWRVARAGTPTLTHFVDCVLRAVALRCFCYPQHSQGMSATTSAPTSAPLSARTPTGGERDRQRRDAAALARENERLKQRMLALRRQVVFEDLAQNFGVGFACRDHGHDPDVASSSGGSTPTSPSRIALGQTAPPPRPSEDTSREISLLKAQVDARDRSLAAMFDEWVELRERCEAIDAVLGRVGRELRQMRAIQTGQQDAPGAQLSEGDAASHTTTAAGRRHGSGRPWAARR